jgi:hypothetical protein
MISDGPLFKTATKLRDAVEDDAVAIPSSLSPLVARLSMPAEPDEVAEEPAAVAAFIAYTSVARRRRPVRRAVAVGAVSSSLTLLLVSGAAAAQILPGPAQRWVAHALNTIGIPIPDGTAGEQSQLPGGGDDREDPSGSPQQSRGAEPSALPGARRPSVEIPPPAHGQSSASPEASAQGDDSSGGDSSDAPRDNADSNASSQGQASSSAGSNNGHGGNADGNGNAPATPPGQSNEHQPPGRAGSGPAQSDKGGASSNSRANRASAGAVQPPERAPAAVGPHAPAGR